MQRRYEVHPSLFPFILMHVACFAALWVGVSWWSLGLCFGLYYFRMFGVTAGYHRYFSHRTYKVGRVPRFLLACMAQSSLQNGVLWWAARHRHHHKYSDQPNDVHSPRQQGFVYAHVGWLFDVRNKATDFTWVTDIRKYPEIRFIDRWHLLPGIMLGLGVWLLAGWEGLVVGFVWSTVLVWHGTNTINSLSHLVGNQPYATDDDSRNCWYLSLITMGEGWHNNHHYCQSSCRQGFTTWQYDATYWILRVLSWMRIVRDIKGPSAAVVAAAWVRNLPQPQVRSSSPITSPSLSGAANDHQPQRTA